MNFHVHVHVYVHSPSLLHALTPQDSGGEIPVDVQLKLNNHGMASLVIKQVSNAPSHPVFLEAVLLGVALLNGGNKQVQVSQGCTCTVYWWGLVFVVAAC